MNNIPAASMLLGIFRADGISTPNLEMQARQGQYLNGWHAPECAQSLRRQHDGKPKLLLRYHKSLARVAIILR
jgi:hypothetical protein